MERGIGWRLADSLSLRSFLDLDVTEAPDHSPLTRTRRRIDVETHVAVFTWVLERLAEAGLVKGKTVGVDATTLEANASMRSIKRRDTRKRVLHPGGWLRPWAAAALPDRRRHALEPCTLHTAGGGRRAAMSVRGDRYGWAVNLRDRGTLGPGWLPAAAGRAQQSS